MATSPQLKAFSNEKARPLADTLYAMYFELVSFQDEYNSKNIGTEINNLGAGNTVDDGSDVDGRTRITGGDLFLLKTIVDDLKFWAEQDATATPSDGKRLALFAKIEVNGRNG